MSSVEPKQILYLSDKLECGYVAPTKVMIDYLGLKEGPTNTLIFAAALDQRGPLSSDAAVLNYIIEVVYDLLKHANFKVGQLPLLGEILVQCPSAEDANKLHQKVKVVRHTVIGFRKMEYVHIAREIGNFVQKRIRDATPEEFKLQKIKEDQVKEMKKIMGDAYVEAGGSSAEAEAAAPKDVAEAGGPNASSDADGSKKRKI